MKIDFEPQDIEAIATRVVEMLRPLLAQRGKGEREDRIFTVEALAEYLGVSPSWIYKQTCLKTIPHFKAGRHPRFRKAEIDRWIEARTVKPIPPLRAAR